MYTKKYLICACMMFLTLIAEGTASAMTLSASANPAILNQPVTFTITVTSSPPPSSVYILFGDGRGNTFVGTTTETNSTFVVSHAYSQAGVYTVQASCVAPIDNPAVEQPNPALLTLRVSDFDIKRIETLFDTGTPQVTLYRNQPAPELSAIVNYSGTGFIKGYWEVDGIKKHHFFKQLSIGPKDVITYPKIPGLSTYKPGSHVVRFVITEPALAIPFPKVVYYITEQAFITDTDITIITPGKDAMLPFKPVTLSWQSVPETEVYMVHIFKDRNDQPIFSAYSKTNSYDLRSEILKRFLKPGQTYYYRIQGFHEDTRPTGKSEFMPLTFTK